MIGLIVYIVVSMLVLFAGSIIFARCGWGDPTTPNTFGPLVGTALAWPITVPFIALGLLFFGIATLAKKLSGKEGWFK